MGGCWLEHVAPAASPVAGSWEKPSPQSPEFKVKMTAVACRGLDAFWSGRVRSCARREEEASAPAAEDASQLVV